MGMQYGDENIIEALNSYKKEQYGDIYSKIYIREEVFEFQWQELFDGKIRVMLPKKFVDMPLEFIRIKYPMEQKPQIIKMNQASNINFTFSLLNMEVKKENIQETKDIFYKAIKSFQPTNIFYENKIEDLEKLTIGWFDYKSHGLDQKIYNLMYCIPIAGQLLHGAFNCGIRDAELWKPCALQVLHSIEDLTPMKE